MMRSSCILLLLAVAVTANADDLENCEILDNNNFKEATESSNLFIMFYAPWCGHCKRLKPTWNEYCEKTNVEGAKTKIAAIDCTVEKDLCSAHGVRGYPTLKFFKEGSPEGVKYAGGRDIPAFEKFVTQAIDPSAVVEEPEVAPCAVPEPENGLMELEDCNFAQVISKDYTFVKFYAPWCGHCKKLAPTWAELAEKMAGESNVKIVKLDCTKHKVNCDKHQISGFPTLVLFNNGKPNDKYRGGRELTQLTSYLRKSVNGTAGGAADPAELDELKAKMLKDLEAETDCPKPTKTDMGLWEVQDCQFNYHIGKGDSFVKFYAPWCGHCKRLAPTWDKLAEHYKASDSVKVTKLDCTANKLACSEHKVRGYPTLMYFRQGKLVEKYESGGRDFDSLKAFVDKQLGDVTTVEELVGKDIGPRIIEPITSPEDLEALVKKSSMLLVLYLMANNDEHAKDHAVLTDFKDRAPSNVVVADVDCNVAEQLCKKEKTLSDDETFLILYYKGKAYRYDNSQPKTTDSLKAFIKDSQKEAIDEVIAKAEALKKKDEL